MKKQKLSASELYRKYGIVLIMIILFVISAVINRNFLKPQNLLNILKQISVVTIIACGETMLIVSGMIDLSAGFLCTTAACFSAGLLAATGNMPAAVLLGIISSFAAIYTPTWYNLVPTLVMIIVMFISPKGLFVKKER